MMKASSRVLVRAAGALRTRGAARWMPPQLWCPLAAASLPRAHFSSHDDFAPQRKTVGNDQNEVQQMIQEHVDQNPIMLYMKGSPKMPMCGFSARVVQTLQAEGVDFASVNVLDYPSIRDGVKQFSQWPTIPQLYVKGEFIGGCDIVEDLHKTGELAELFKEFKTSSE